MLIESELICHGPSVHRSIQAAIIYGVFSELQLFLKKLCSSVWQNA